MLSEGEKEKLKRKIRNFFNIQSSVIDLQHIYGLQAEALYQKIKESLKVKINFRTFFKNGKFTKTELSSASSMDEFRKTLEKSRIQCAIIEKLHNNINEMLQEITEQMSNLEPEEYKEMLHIIMQARNTNTNTEDRDDSMLYNEPEVRMLEVMTSEEVFKSIRNIHEMFAEKSRTIKAGIEQNLSSMDIADAFQLATKMIESRNPDKQAIAVKDGEPDKNINRTTLRENLNIKKVVIEEIIKEIKRKLEKLRKAEKTNGYFLERSENFETTSRIFLSNIEDILEREISENTLTEYAKIENAFIQSLIKMDLDIIREIQNMYDLKTFEEKYYKPNEIVAEQNPEIVSGIFDLIYSELDEVVETMNPYLTEIQREKMRERYYEIKFKFLLLDAKRCYISGKTLGDRHFSPETIGTKEIKIYEKKLRERIKRLVESSQSKNGNTIGLKADTNSLFDNLRDKSFISELIDLETRKDPKENEFMLHIPIFSLRDIIYNDLPKVLKNKFDKLPDKDKAIVFLLKKRELKESDLLSIIEFKKKLDELNLSIYDMNCDTEINKRIVELYKRLRPKETETETEVEIEVSGNTIFVKEKGIEETGTCHVQLYNLYNHLQSYNLGKEKVYGKVQIGTYEIGENGDIHIIKGGKRILTFLTPKTNELMGYYSYNKNGNREGPSRFYDCNGCLRKECTHKDGKLEECKKYGNRRRIKSTYQYDKDGRLEELKTYVDNSLETKSTYQYDKDGRLEEYKEYNGYTGRLRVKITYKYEGYDYMGGSTDKDGTPSEGEWENYDSDGCLIRRAYKDGRSEEYEKYDYMGILIIKGTFKYNKDGRVDGEMEAYNSYNGRLIEKRIYKDGKLVKREEYDSYNGSLKGIRIYNDLERAE